MEDIATLEQQLRDVTIMDDLQKIATTKAKIKAKKVDLRQATAVLAGVQGDDDPAHASSDGETGTDSTGGRGNSADTGEGDSSNKGSGMALMLAAVVRACLLRC